MNFNGFNNFDDFMNFCGYKENNQGNQFNDGEGCRDMPGGFQDLNPQLFILIGELMGNIMAGSLPFNVQNAVGNWLQLVGQAIETFNAQQQYQQNGPGRYYNPKNKNVTNPFCPNDGTNNTSTNQGSSGNEEIEELKSCICNLLNEVQKLRKEVEDIKKDK
ncbi:hypothetical protein ACQPU1_04585 [Clostridium paraputrificum]|uniref:hypothetical protein n=1 Tax=Clostridium TaxID=1485 RepID=UPI003D346628